jgi:hypothetical protein
VPSTFLYIDAAYTAIGIKHNAFGFVSGIVIEMPACFAAKQHTVHFT